jgi:hypothetical protein
LATLACGESPWWMPRLDVNTRGLVPPRRRRCLEGSGRQGADGLAGRGPGGIELIATICRIPDRGVRLEGAISCGNIYQMLKTTTAAPRLLSTLRQHIVQLA